mgnify:CR=1 FL=1
MKEAELFAENQWEELDDLTKRMYILDSSHTMREVMLLKWQIAFLLEVRTEPTSLIDEDERM